MNKDWTLVKISDLEELDNDLRQARANVLYLCQQLRARDSGYNRFLEWQTWGAAGIMVILGFLLGGVV